MGWGVSAILWIGRSVSSWPAATLPVPPMPGWGLAVFSLGLAWLGLWRTRQRLLGLLPMALGLLSPLLVPLPDVLVSADARLIALRADGAYWMQAVPGASKFTLEEWERHLGAGPLRPIREGEPAGCTAATCRIGTVLMLREGVGTADCAGAGLVVSAEPARGVCPSEVKLIDRFSVWRDGAEAAFVSGATVQVASDRSTRGDRPWVPPPPTPRRATPNLPMAPAETLPPATDE